MGGRYSVRRHSGRGTCTLVYQLLISVDVGLNSWMEQQLRWTYDIMQTCVMGKGHGTVQHGPRRKEAARHCPG